MDVTKKIFINPAWTAASKVPETSARGVELVYGVNAFASIADAKTALGSFSDNGLYVNEKAVYLDDVDGIAMISSQEPNAVETIKDNGTSITDAMQVKLAGNGQIAIDADASSPVLVQGYKNVDIIGTGDFTVVGGNNNVARTYTYTDKGTSISVQRADSINSAAAGNLNVAGANLTVAGLLFDYSDDTVGWYSYTGEVDMDLALASLYPIAGYANVALVAATAGDFAGGNFKGSQTSNNIDYADGSYSYSSKANMNYGAAGRLTLVDGSTIGIVTGYSDVTISDGSSFAEIDGRTISVASDSSDVYTDNGTAVSHVIASKYARTQRSAGRAAISDATGDNVIGYASVTVADSTIGYAEAGATTESTKGNYDYKLNASVESEKTASITSATAALDGTLTAADTTFGADVIAYKRVDLVDTEVTGAIAAYTDGSDYGRAFNEATTQNATSSISASGDENETSDVKYTRLEAAAGTVTVVGGKVGAGIVGYSNVGIADAEFGGDVTAGTYRDDTNTSYKRTLRNGVETITKATTSKETENAIGNLTAAASVADTPAIDGFQNVTLTDITGSVDEVDGGNAEVAKKEQITIVDGVETIKMSSAGTATAVGTFTGKNTIADALEIAGDVEGFNKVVLTNAKVGGDIAGGNYSSKYSIDARDLADDSAIVTRFSTDYAEGVEGTETARKLVGSVDLNQTEVSGNVTGYASITLANSATIAGDVNFVDEDGDGVNDPMTYKFTRNYRNNVESQFVSQGSTPSAALTLKSGTTVAGDAYSIAKLTLENDTTLGSVDMVASNSVDDIIVKHAAKGDNFTSKYAENITAGGAATVTPGSVVGAIYGAKSVNVTSATVGELDAFNSNYATVFKGTTFAGDVVTVEMLESGTVDPYTLTQFERSEKDTKTATGNATLTDAAVTNLSGFVKVTAAYTDLNGLIAGGKSAYTSTEKFTNNSKGATDVITTSRAIIANGTLTATDGSVDGAQIEALQNVTLTRVEGSAGSAIGGNLTAAGTTSSYVISGVSGIKTAGSETVAAAGAFTATGVSAGTDPVLSFAEIDGFANVKLTSANVDGSIIATNYLDKLTAENNGSGLAASERTFTSKYTGSVDISMGILDGVATVGGDINGYAKVTLSDVQVAGGINTASAYEWMNTKDAVAVRTAPDDTLTAFSASYSSATVANAQLTLTDGAIVSGDANNIGKLIVGPATQLLGEANMYNSSVAGSIGITLKNGAYNGSEKGSSTLATNGAVVINGVVDDVAATVVGGINGAKSVSASWATIGDIIGWDQETVGQREAANATITTTVDGDGNIVAATFDNGESGTLKQADNYGAKGKVILTDAIAGGIEGASSVDITRTTIDYAEAGVRKSKEEWSWRAPDFATDWQGTRERVDNVVGSFNATDAEVASGDVDGFAKVNLTSAYVDGAIDGGNWAEKATYTYGVGTITQTLTVAGATVAVDSVIGGDISENATVRLDNSLVGGSVIGGDWTWTFEYDYTPITTTVVAAGALTATDSIISGDVTDLKTAAFDGVNLVGGSVAGVTSVAVKNGITEIQAEYSYVGSEGNDSVAVDKLAILQVTKMDFGAGNDTLGIGGTVRVLGADDETLLNVEKLGGNGIFAVTDAYYTGDLAAALNGVAVDKALSIVDAGTDIGVKAIRTKAEELGDNNGRAQVMADEVTEFTGWLCANEDYGFVDTVDWISFTQNSGESLAFAVTDDIAGTAGDLEVSLYKNGAYIGDETAFSGLADGDYELKLELTGTTAGPLAYAVTRA